MAIASSIAYYTQASVDTHSAVQACLMQIVPLSPERLEREGRTCWSGLLCVSKRQAWQRVDPRLIHWELIDSDGHFKIWRARDSNSLLLKESYHEQDGFEYEIASVYTQWDVITRRLLPLTDHPTLQLLSCSPSRSELSRTEKTHNLIKVCYVVFQRNVSDALQGLSSDFLIEYIRNVVMLFSDWTDETEQERILKRSLKSFIPFLTTPEPAHCSSKNSGVLEDKSWEQCARQSFALIRGVILISSSPAFFRDHPFPTPFKDFTPLQNISLLMNMFAVDTIPIGAFRLCKREKIFKTLQCLGVEVPLEEISTRIDLFRALLPISCFREDAVVRGIYLLINVG